MGGNNGIPTCKFPAKGSAGEGSFYPNRIQNFLVIHSACGYVKFNHHKICLRFFPIIKNYTFWNISIKDIHNLFFGDLNGFLYFVNSLNSFDSIFFVVASFSSSFFLILFINTPPLFLFIYYFFLLLLLPLPPSSLLLFSPLIIRSTFQVHRSAV